VVANCSPGFDCVRMRACAVADEIRPEFGQVVPDVTDDGTKRKKEQKERRKE